MRLAKHRDATVRHYRAALGVLLCRWWSWAIPEQKILRAGIRARPGATLRALEFHVSGRRWGYAQDRKSVVSGKSVSVRVDHGGRHIFKTNKLINKLFNSHVCELP